MTIKVEDQLEGLLLRPPGYLNQALAKEMYQQFKKEVAPAILASAQAKYPHNKWLVEETKAMEQGYLSNIEHHGIKNNITSCSCASFSLGCNMLAYLPEAKHKKIYLGAMFWLLSDVQAWSGTLIEYYNNVATDGMKNPTMDILRELGFAPMFLYPNKNHANHICVAYGLICNRQEKTKLEKDLATKSSKYLEQKPVEKDVKKKTTDMKAA